MNGIDAVIDLVGGEIQTRSFAILKPGNLAVNVGIVLSLADASVAHEMLEGTRPRSRGKIVLSVGE